MHSAIETIQFRSAGLALCVTLSIAATVWLAYAPQTVLLAAAGLIALILVWRQPFLGLLGMVLLAMAGELQHFESGFSVQQAVAALVTARVALPIVLGGENFRYTGLTLPLFVFALILAGLQARFGGAEIEGLTVLTVLGYPIAFWLFLQLVRTERQIAWVIAAVAFGAVLAAAGTLLQSFADFSLLSALRGIDPADRNVVAEGWERAIGLMQSPNVQAYPYLVAIPLMVATIFSKPRRWIRLALYAGTGLCFLGLVITFSRSGYIGLVAGLAWLALALPGSNARRLLAGGAGLVLCTFLLVPPDIMIARFLAIPEQMGGQSDRLVHYKAGLATFLRNPLWGGGPRVFGSELVKREGGEPDIPHANLLVVAVDSGLLGFAALGWFLKRYGRLLRRGWGSLGWSPPRYYALGFCGGLIAFLVQGLFEANMGWSLVWALAAVPACCVLAEPPIQNPGFPHSLRQTS
ncbi:MAG TPA: O-antigen ligase family protein [Candidatus Sulfotelmatobacter sp.]|nr:O-antigen ligase family protein [Candidatus Sulfotelmatobacter sp.]